MKHPTGLRKGLVEQWQAAVSPTEKFQFLKAYLLDKEMSSIEIQPYFEELSEQKNTEHFIELPLNKIVEQYGHLAGGPAFIESIKKDQAGRAHPQSTDENMRIYKIFKCMDFKSLQIAIIIQSESPIFSCMHDLLIRGAQISRVGSKTSASVKPSTNKAERQALVDSVENKIGSMKSPAGLPSEVKTKARPKPKKETCCRCIHLVCVHADLDSR
ncbi:NaCP60E [Symbiodinium necroappetens]|uniref:NaCP60E protein n=1 Tax=Symbiodinium necroappetens TaxID=1628268 RepID=A0A812Z8E8_9DINO|nr:NaCP60E [Symbiodinium necroappetens]